MNAWIGFHEIGLTKIGLSVMNVDWIMACIMLVHYIVLINGVPSIFFNASCGLPQGCSLSPLIFLLVIDRLSKKKSKAQPLGYFSLFWITCNISITHLIFLHDILLMGLVSILEWNYLYQIICTFGDASSLFMNKSKSILIIALPNELSIIQITNIFKIDVVPLDCGFKYFGFIQKPNRYGTKDWCWLMDNFERRLSPWSNKWLTFGGRLLLIQSIFT